MADMTSTTVTPTTDAVVLRPARADEDKALRDLAALDSTDLGAGPHLVAEVGGELRAAVSLHGGKAAADPFHPTAAYVDLLRARAASLAEARPIRRRRRLEGGWRARTSRVLMAHSAGRP
jgi:hypothetical protein